MSRYMAHRRRPWAVRFAVLAVEAFGASIVGFLFALAVLWAASMLV